MRCTALLEMSLRVQTPTITEPTTTRLPCSIARLRLLVCWCCDSQLVFLLGNCITVLFVNATADTWSFSRVYAYVRITVCSFNFSQEFQRENNYRIVATPPDECNCTSVHSTHSVHSWVSKHQPRKPFVSGPKFTSFFSSNVEGIVVDSAVFRLSIS